MRFGALGYLCQALSHTYSAVAREGAHLKYVLGTYHLDKHLEQPTLQMARRHTSMYGVYVGGTVETIEIVALRSRVGKYVFL